MHMTACALSLAFDRAGKIGDTYRVDYATSLAPTTWIPLSTNLLTTSPQLVLDASSPGDKSRFYQAVFLY
jgi:hypothetical protein